MLSLLAHLINVALALLFWLVIGRFVLKALIGNRPNIILGAFERGTDPLFHLMRGLTRGLAPEPLLPLLTLGLLLALRLALLPLLRTTVAP